MPDLFESTSIPVVELYVDALPEPGERPKNGKLVKTLGSGTLIDTHGSILTAGHVVERAANIDIVFSDKMKSKGRVVWIDVESDVAMIKADWVPESINPAVLGNSDDTRIGDRIFVIGAPYGISKTLTVGHLSGKRTVPAEVSSSDPEFLQTDAAINTGNSGGPMFNMKGELIGVVSHIMSRSGGSDGLGFALSSNSVRKIVQEGPLPWAGIIPLMMDDKLANAVNSPVNYGALIQQVIPNSLADTVGLRGGDFPVRIGKKTLLLGGDIILEFGGVEMDSIESLRHAREMSNNLKSGEELTIKIYRRGEYSTITMGRKK
ncbi:S1C family serine protease [Echinimonas agarilytica]|uniref:Trypsin-like peptidase domain-containing protein n=1 Tax=Echinimonas agarilytica TaxID=1215918 RepID=A0AA41W665_9GAMM|nr:trypsin-like peptidase domain-containing protein [Echinimonas agarilytica]MCM2679446.1 trypsin-like peptidase domain-containing protein [Echinimonas agarilytica]